MIRIILLLLVAVVIIGGGFLYFWDVPADQAKVSVPVDTAVFRD